MADFPLFTHIVITVSDLSVSAPWYQQLIGAEPVLDEDVGEMFHHTVFPIGDQLLSLHGFKPKYAKKGPADEFRPGLDHIAFGVPTRDDLSKWAARLEELGIEHGEILDAHFGSGLAFRDPDNIQLEFFAPPNT